MAQLHENRVRWPAYALRSANDRAARFSNASSGGADARGRDSLLLERTRAPCKGRLAPQSRHDVLLVERFSERERVQRSSGEIPDNLAWIGVPADAYVLR
jgi:hypothetical protein